MNDYAECVEYLAGLGFPADLCEKICKRFEKNNDMKGLLDYLFLCEIMVDSCVD